MIITHLDQVTVRYQSEPIFESLSWQIHNDRCVGLVGPNGSGKSTLLRLIAGEVTTDTGYVIQPRNLSIGYLRQEPRFDQQHTLLAEALTASDRLMQTEAELEEVETRLEDPAVYGDGRRLAQALDHQAKLLERYSKLGGPGYRSRVMGVLRQLGFSNDDFGLSVAMLSGGQKKLLGLAKLLVTQPDMLLLDEPDNHLDLDGKTFLEEFIRGYKGGVVIVSHDRFLLDVIADEIVELEDGTLTSYPGNYSEFAFEKQRQLLRHQQLYQIQQREISRLEQAAQRLLTWGRSHDNEKLIKRGKNILRRLERIDRVERPVLERKQMALELKGWRGSNKVLEITDLVKFFEQQLADQAILDGVSLLIWHGERVGVIGPNGSGKSTLFRLILSEEQPSAGQITIGPSVSIGYYAQQHETLDYAQTLIEAVRMTGNMTESHAVSFLGKFLFNYEQARNPIATLSGGERSRLQMALLMLSQANFLLLDEPTNNLDIPSAEILENALAEFEGTVLVISHDRYFLDRVVQRILSLDRGRVTETLGNYSDYQAAHTPD